MWDAELLYRELPATRGAGIPEVWVSAKGRATGFPSHPFRYKWRELTAMAAGWGWPGQPYGLRDHAASPVVQQRHGVEVHRLGNRARASRR